MIPREKGDAAKVRDGQAGEAPDKAEKVVGRTDQVLEVYEEQYDPNQEFRIFGIGDKTKGGVQSLQEKMNLADDADSGSSEEEQE